MINTENSIPIVSESDFMSIHIPNPPDTSLQHIEGVPSEEIDRLLNEEAILMQNFFKSHQKALTPKEKENENLKSILPCNREFYNVI